MIPSPFNLSRLFKSRQLWHIPTFPGLETFNSTKFNQFNHDKFVRYASTSPSSRKHLVILGAGWAGFKLIKKIDTSSYHVTLISPRPYFVFTPLLASACVGTLPFECTNEPVRNHTRDDMVYHQAWVENINWSDGSVVCHGNLPQDLPGEEGTFKVPFDELVIAVGCHNNTFGIPGVREYGHFLKDVNDAYKIRRQIIDCFEYADFSKITSKSPEDWLSFCVVGAGPTGVEFSAELADFVRDDVSKAYPHLMDKVSITLFDVAPQILNGFDKHLQEYATKRFSRTGIKIRTETVIEKVEDGFLVLKNGERVPFGCLVWNTGLVSSPLTENIKDFVARDRRGRIVVDEYFQVLNHEGKVVPGVYAVGDCALTKPRDRELQDPGNGLPQTAQVANQEATFLVKMLNDKALGREWQKQGFVYHHRGSMVYAGSWRALVDFTSAELKGPGWLKGRIAWLLWRTSYWTQQVSLKNKILIPAYWFLTWILGRNISRF